MAHTESNPRPIFDRVRDGSFDAHYILAPTNTGPNLLTIVRDLYPAEAKRVSTAALIVGGIAFVAMLIAYAYSPEHPPTMRDTIGSALTVSLIVGGMVGLFTFMFVGGKFERYEEEKLSFARNVQTLLDELQVSLDEFLAMDLDSTISRARDVLVARTQEILRLEAAKTPEEKAEWNLEICKRKRGLEFVYNAFAALKLTEWKGYGKYFELAKKRREEAVQ